MAQLLKADGNVVLVQPKNGKDFKLDEMQAMVGGSIEIAYLHKDKAGRILVVDEEGLLKSKPINTIATLMYRAFTDPEGGIVGDALLCKSSEVK